MEKILEVKNICKTYQAQNGEIEALKDINFSVKQGEYISIIGPSGCGKSTLLSIIAGLENKTSGEIYVNGKIGYMLQKDNLLEWRTIYKNVLLGLEIQKSLTPQNKEYVVELLKKYGLYEFNYKILKNENITALMVTHDISEAISMSDRVIVLTHRPATVKKIYNIDFEMENRTPLTCREQPKFSQYFNLMWKELEDKKEKGVGL